MIDKALFDQYANALKVNANLLESAIRSLETELSGLTGQSFKTALAARYAALVKTYGNVAARCAVEFYETLRGMADVSTAYEALQSESRSSEYLVSEASEIMKTSTNPSNSINKLAGRAVQRSMEQADDTLLDNAKRDPAHPKWALVPSMGACSWCVLLASQGFVYASDKSIARSRHPNCKCTSVIDFDTKNPSLEGYDEKKLRSQYREARRKVESGAVGEWSALTKEEREKYNNKYDRYLRNRIVGQMRQDAK